MPRKKKTEAANPTEALAKLAKDAFLSQAVELWDANQDKFLKVAKDGEKPAINLTFKASFDMAESAASLTTTLRYSEVFTDERVTNFDDPNQVPLPLEGEETEGGES